MFPWTHPLWSKVTSDDLFSHTPGPPRANLKGGPEYEARAHQGLKEEGMQLSIQTAKCKSLLKIVTFQLMRGRANAELSWLSSGVLAW